MLKKGDTCYVRLKNGTIVKAIYEQRVDDEKWHWVIVGNYEYLLAVDKIFHSDTCRFVCMTGIKGKDNG